MVDLTENEKEIVVLAALEINRANQYRRFQKHVKQAGDVDTSSQDLTIDITSREDRLYIITAMSAWDKDSQCDMIRLGLKGADTFFFTSNKPSTSLESVDFGGQILAVDGESLIARFEGATATDTIHYTVNGYWIRDIR
ncbi:MAG: hypothetical protein SVV88_11685 [Pseudomonadota bacterium]|nr:hypothetical protein [Pseudomonadota bacterium]